jgi:riboflavin biosynthesis pyrimidine reductase
VSLTRLFPPTDIHLDWGVEAQHPGLVELYRPPRADWLRLNLIGSVSGSAAGVDGTSETLTNPTDRMILRIIRDLSDVVLVGAASVRAEGYFVPRHAALAVVTGSGDLSGHRVRSGANRGALLIVCPFSAVPTAKRTLGNTAASLIEVPDIAGRMSPDDIVGALRIAGYQSIVCEGGPGLAAQLVNAGLVDEFCLTTSPVLNGASLPLFGGHEFAERTLALTQLLSDELSFLYGRWELRER